MSSQVLNVPMGWDINHSCSQKLRGHFNQNTWFADLTGLNPSLHQSVRQNITQLKMGPCDNAATKNSGFPRHVNFSECTHHWPDRGRIFLGGQVKSPSFSSVSMYDDSLIEFKQINTPSGTTWRLQIDGMPRRMCLRALILQHSVPFIIIFCKQTWIAVRPSHVPAILKSTSPA